MIEINLLPEELKAKPKSQKIGINLSPSQFLYLIPLLFVILILMHISFVILSIAKSNEYRALNSKWQKMEPQKKILESYNMENASLSESGKLIQQLTEQRISWSEKLNKLSAFLPSGIWFNDLSYSGSDFVIQASVISLQRDEMSLIAKLIDNLKNDPAFLKGFTSLELGPVQHRTIGSFDIADFSLTGSIKNK
jgi:Tfp pilus assembly protein PilN